MKKLCLYIILSVSLLQIANSQIFQKDYKTRTDSLRETGSVYLNLQGATWFYNNEYFNPY